MGAAPVGLGLTTPPMPPGSVGWVLKVTLYYPGQGTEIKRRCVLKPGNTRSRFGYMYSYRKGSTGREQVGPVTCLGLVLQ